jgi:putative ABC transport system permease protein
MWRATLKGLLAHRFRLALTALSVVLGVAFVAGTYVLTDTMNAAFDQLFTEATAGTDVIVRAEAPFVEEDRERIPEELLPVVRQVEGVRVTEGSVVGFAQLVDKEGEAISPTGPPTLGVSFGEIPDLTPLTIREGRPPERDAEVAIDAATARKHDFSVGDRVTVLFQGPSEEFTVVGIAGFGEADNLGGATLAAFDLQTAQRVLGAEGQFDTIEVAGQEGISTTVLRQRIASVLPEGVQAVTAQSVADEQANEIQDELGFFNIVLLVFAGIALFVGAFIIFNTFNILVTQRTRELALLRALGATGGQVTRSVMAEALITGVVASALGLALGIAVALGLQALLQGFGIDLPTTNLQVLPRTIVASFVVGTVVTVVAAVLPARRASRVPPIAAIRDVESVRPISLRRRALAGGAVAAFGVAMLMLGLFGGVGNAISYVGLGVGVIFLGVAILSPLAARPVSRAIGAPLPRVAGVPGKLGRENAMRNPRRTAATSAALMIGLALVGTSLIMGSSLKASTGRIIDETLRADLFLSAGNQFTGFSPEVAAELAGRPGIGVVSELRTGEWRQRGSTAIRFLTAVEPATVDRVLELDVLEGSVSALDRRGVMVHEDAAEAEGLAVGDVLAMEFARTGTVQMRVAGIFAENRLVGDYVISISAYEDNFTEQLDSFVLVKAPPGASVEDARRAVQRVTEAFPNVDVQDQAEIREEQEDAIDQLLGLLSALLGLAILIALLGIVNTLALSVFERTREVGLLRAVGMSRRQVRSMVRWESVLIALLGGVLGLAVGAFFGWAMVTALGDEGITELSIPARQLVVFLALAGLAGVVAAILPARRAARLNVLAAIATE